MDSVENPNNNMLEAMFGSHQHWIMYLDWLDGLVAQTIQRGFSEQQSREIVVAMVAGGARPSEPPK